MVCGPKSNGGSRLSMAKIGKGIKHITGDIWLLDYQVNGVRRQERVRACSSKEARTIRDERIVDLRRQQPALQDDTERLHAGFDEAWDKLSNDITSDGLCDKNIVRHKRVFWRMFGDFRKRLYPQMTSVSQVTTTFLLEYKNYFINELKLSPIGGWRAEVICIKSMMRRLKRYGYCGEEVLRVLGDIKKPKQEKKSYPNITKSQIADILSRAKRERPDYYNIIYYIIRTGRRIGETIKIERRDVEWQGLKPVRLNIRPETTKARAFLPLTRLDEDLEQLIRDAYALSSKHKTLYLFCTRRGKKCTDGRVRDYLNKVSEDITGIRLGLHFFRHRFLTECGNGKISMPDAMAIAGIKDFETVLKHYNHNTDEGMAKVLECSRV